MTQPREQYLDSLCGKDRISVLFVCLGNICRSPAAEGVMKAFVEARGDVGRWYIDSCGTGGWHVGDLPDRRMRVHGQRRGYNFDHICRQVRVADFDRFDIIIPMDESNARDLHEMAPTADDDLKIIPMIDFVTLATRHSSVPDPYYVGAEGFELVLDMLENAVYNLYHRLTP